MGVLLAFNREKNFVPWLSTINPGTKFLSYYPHKFDGELDLFLVMCHTDYTTLLEDRQGIIHYAHTLHWSQTHVLVEIL